MRRVTWSPARAFVLKLLADGEWWGITDICKAAPFVTAQILRVLPAMRKAGLLEVRETLHREYRLAREKAPEVTS